MPERKRETIYQEVTDLIIAELEQGRVPWVQPWGKAKAGIGLPKNAATERSYSGINILILWGAVIEKGYPAQNWLTFRQALSLGGHVRKGERGTTVVYADRFIPKDEQQRAAEDGDEPQAVPFLKRFTVSPASCSAFATSASAAPSLATSASPSLRASKDRSASASSATSISKPASRSRSTSRPRASRAASPSPSACWRKPPPRFAAETPSFRPMGRDRRADRRRTAPPAAWASGGAVEPKAQGE